MKKLKYTIVAALFVAASVIELMAGTIVNSPSKSSSSNLTGSLETSLISNYADRGTVIDSNPVLVPKLSLAYPLFNGGTFQFATEQAFGTKGSSLFRSKYEFGLALTAGRFTVTPGYEIKSYHNQNKPNTQEVSGRISFNDEGLLPISIRPYIYGSKGVDPKGGLFYEAGIQPTKNLGKLTVSFPVSVGVSSNDYLASTTKDVKYMFTSAGVSLVYDVTDRFALKASSIYYNTDKTLANSSANFLQNSVGVSVSF